MEWDYRPNWDSIVYATTVYIAARNMRLQYMTWNFMFVYLLSVSRLKNATDCGCHRVTWHEGIGENIFISGEVIAGRG